MFKQLNTAHIAKNSASFCNFIYFKNDLLPSFSCLCVYSEEVDVKSFFFIAEKI